MNTRTRLRSALVGVAALSLGLAGCSANPTANKSTSGASTVADDPNAPLTIWTDATRQEGFEAYKKAHPDKKITITVVDGSQLLNKIQLANRAGKGWPDVIWGDVVVYQLASKQYQNFAQPLDDLLTEEQKKGFGTTNEVCTYEGKTYCLRNDVAPSVLYYNTETFAKRGYQVPTTWEQYWALGEKMAKDDPNLRVQIEGHGGMQMLQYYQASGCPLAQLTGATEMTVNWNDPKCTRVTQGLDRLIKAGVLKFDQLNEKQTQAQGANGTMAMTLGAVWRADYVFGPGYKWKQGTLGVAKVPTWDGEKPLTGYEGGGQYVMSSHTANKKGAMDVLNHMATGDYQKKAGTLPAYEPVRQPWMQTHVLTNKLYAKPQEVPAIFNASVDMLSPDEKLTSYNPRDPWEQVVTPALRQGKSIADMIPDLQKRSVAAAKAAGLTVKEG